MNNARQVIFVLCFLVIALGQTRINAGGKPDLAIINSPGSMAQGRGENELTVLLGDGNRSIRSDERIAIESGENPKPCCVAPERTVDWYLARAGVSDYVVDFRRAPKDETVSQWLQAAHRMHWVGAIFSDEWSELQWTRAFVLSRDFDGLIFIEKTTRARPTLTGRREDVSK